MTPDTTDFNSLSKKQLVELVIAKYNDCFRLEEENKKLEDEVKDLVERNIELDKKYMLVLTENKKLKEQLERMKIDTMYDMKDINSLYEENRKLKEHNGELIENHKKDIAILCEENKKLKETIKDHQLYEEKLEHRIIEFEELLHGE